MEKNKQQTALDWFYDKTVIEGKTNYHELLEQAKRLEQEQIIEAWTSGWKDHDNTRSAAIKYYDKTYNDR